MLVTSTKFPSKHLTLNSFLIFKTFEVAGTTSSNNVIISILSYIGKDIKKDLSLIDDLNDKTY